MPIETDLSVPPYYDDFSEEKDFYKVLHKPSVAVQARELNQYQSIIQGQVERFGDSVFKRGTIVEGCNFVFKDPYPYVKLEDSETDGSPTAPSSYVGLFARNASGLNAFIMDYKDGFETSVPDLKTLYVRYVDSGDDSNTFAFSAGETLTIYDSNTSLMKVKVNNGGVGFSNSDKIVVTPAVIVNVSTGSFTNGEYVNQPDFSSSNLQIVWIDDTTLATEGQVILGLRPRPADLANVSVNSSAWTVTNAYSIRNASNTAVAAVEGVVGTGATGGVVTDGSGRITSVVMTSRGRDYLYDPYVSVRSANNSTGITALDLDGLAYISQVKVANVALATGNGYAFGVTKGVIYQKGHFLRVAPQDIIVSKYDQSPNGVTVGFSSIEEIVTSYSDTSLNDPVNGDNHNAPGADRLKITPTLTLGVAGANVSEDFFPVVEWSEGRPSKMQQDTVYSTIGDEMATRTSDSDGDFVIDRFEVTTRSTSNSSLEGSKMDVVVDPGLAYISGYRVKTSRNYVVTVDKGTNTVTQNTSITLDYDYYIKVNNMGGAFQCATGDVVQFRSAKGLYVTNGSYGTEPTAPGDLVGTGRVKSVTYEAGIQGNPGSVFRIYLAGLALANDHAWSEAQSVFYDGSVKGVADIVRTPTGSLIFEPTRSVLAFPSGGESVRNVNNATYVYRTTDQSVTVSNSGTLTLSLASNPDEFFLRTGAYTDTEMMELILVPTSNLVASSNIAGSVAALTTSSNLTGTSTTFLTDLRAGDYVTLSGNSTQSTVRRVVSVVNNTLVKVDSNVSFANATTGVYRTFPRGVAVPLGRRSGLTVNVDSNGNIMTIDLDTALAGSADANASLTFDVERRGVDVGTKQASRNRYVKVCLANNDGETVGPWCLGVSDVFRLRGVWVGSNSSVSESDTEVTSDFVVDTNHGQNQVGLSYLYKDPRTSLRLESDDWLLVKIDHFTVTDPGFYATPSYVTANATQVATVDSTPLANLGTEISSWEIIRPMSAFGGVHDAINLIDFRLIANNTANSTANAETATINPSDVVSFGNTVSLASSRKIPKPGAEMTFTREQYLGRTDSVVAGIDGNITVLKGRSAFNRHNRNAPPAPADSILLNTVDVPPYPTLPIKKSTVLSELVNTGVAVVLNQEDLYFLAADDKEKGTKKPETNGVTFIEKEKKRTAIPGLTQEEVEQTQPARLTMKDVGAIEQRVTNLEYYASLSLLESSVKDLVIPTSGDATLNRFKFGFFVDDFDDRSLMAVTDPECRATVQRGHLVPGKASWIVGYDAPPLPSYMDWAVITQDHATGEPEHHCFSEVSVVNAVAFDSRDPWTHPHGPFGLGYDPNNLTETNVTRVVAANVSGPMAIYFDLRPAPDFIRVYQGNVVLKTTNDAENLTNSDITMLHRRPEQLNQFGSWFYPGSLTAISRPFEEYDNSNGFVRFAGKLAWTHNPALGRTYTVVTGVGKLSSWWRWAMEYPQSTETSFCPPAPRPSPADYEGFMNVNRTGPLHATITCFGLKPRTKHSIKLDNFDSGFTIIDNSTGAVVVVSQLTSNSSGAMSFTLVHKTFTEEELDKVKRVEVYGPGSGAWSSWKTYVGKG